MDNKTLHEQRKQDLLLTVNHKTPSAVPVMLNINSGVLSYAKVKVKDALKSDEAFVDAYVKFTEYIYGDCVTFPGIFVNQAGYEAMGSGQNRVAHDGYTVEHVQASYMKEDEYPLLIKDPAGFVKDTLLPRKYPFLFDGNTDKAVEALKNVFEGAVDVFGVKNGLVEKAFEERFGIVTALSPNWEIGSPLDMIFDMFRGFAGTLTDLRRRPQEVKAAAAVLWEQRVDKLDAIDDIFPFVAQTPHVPAYLSPKQYEELYWPYEKLLIEKIHSKGNKASILLEGRWMHVVECFKEVPKDSTILMIDDDDPFELKKKMGDHVTLLGGAKMSTIILSSKETCIDYTKKVIDELAPGGGFIFCTDKGWLSKADINDNLAAVYAFVHEYGKY